MNDVHQMIAVIQIYIHHRTGKEVRINPPRKPNEFFLLTKAHQIAASYLGFTHV